MTKALWLCSWYPSDAAPFNGDFVQRHAQAAALYATIHVIHVTGWGGEEKISENRQGNLSEHILLYTAKKGLLGKFLNQLKWKKLFQSAVEKYISANGKPDIVHVHVPMKAGLIAQWIKKKYGIPYIATEHWTIYDSANKNNLSTRSFLFRRILKNIIKNAELLVPVSDNLGQLITKNVYAKSYKMIPNNANTEYFNYNSSFQPAEKFRFIHVSNLNYQKNAEAIVEFFAKLANEIRNIELVIAGPASAEFIELVKNTGQLNQSIYILGEISYSQVAEEMKKSHALILFSRFENLPCVIVEALCCGLPVISTPVGGIPEHLGKENSILVESENTVQLFNAMKEMVNNYNRYDRQQIAESAQNKFSFTVTGKKITDMYLSVIEK